MGIASILAENQRLRRDLVTKDSAHAAALAERDARLAEREAQIAALTVSNEDMAQRLDLLRIKASDRRNQRHTEDDTAVIPLPFVFNEPSPPPRLPQPEPVESVERPAVRAPRIPSKRRDLSQPSSRPTRKLRCAIDPAAACARCGGPLKVFAVAHNYRLEWVPGHFETLDIERERCACPACPSAGVLVAPPPSFALPKAMCGNGLLARVLVDKFADRIPLNLQAKRMAREGEEFSTTTLSDWVLHAAAPGLLGRIAAAIDERLMRGAWLQADDTGYPVQDGTDGQLRKGRLWAVTDQAEVRYHFTDTKEGHNPASFLAKYAGKLLLVDGGSEFNLAVAQKGLLRAGCWSHLRTYFFDARHHHPREARLALGTLRDLFAIEAGLVAATLEDRRSVRDLDARPLVDGLYAWMLTLRTATRPTSLLGQALTYAINGREFFERFLDHPELPMHNNRSELASRASALRGPVCGRKQWLFAGSEGGAHAGATMFTLIESCAMQGIDPWAYLADVLSRIQEHPVSRIHELTPMNWRIAQEGRKPA